MKNEADPITEDEWLLRRVHKMWFATSKTPIISKSAFEPRVEGRDPDIDGISLYRADCLNSPEEILAPVALDKRPAIGIVRIQVKTLLQMGWTVAPMVDAQVKGHVVVPELNSKDYPTAKSQFTPSLLNMAKEASRDENIVRRPPDLG